MFLITFKVFFFFKVFLLMTVIIFFALMNIKLQLVLKLYVP